MSPEPLNLLGDFGQAAVPHGAKYFPSPGPVERMKCNRGRGSAWKRKRRFPWGSAGQGRPAS